jgi:hypothetical protein
LSNDKTLRFVVDQIFCFNLSVPAFGKRALDQIAELIEHLGPVFCRIEAIIP